MFEAFDGCLFLARARNGEAGFDGLAFDCVRAFAECLPHFAIPLRRIVPQGLQFSMPEESIIPNPNPLMPSRASTGDSSGFRGEGR